MTSPNTLASIKAELAAAQRRGDFAAVEAAMKRIELTVGEYAERRKAQSNTPAAPVWDRNDTR